MQSPIETSLQSFFNTIAAEFTNALGSIQHFFQEPQDAIESYNQALRLNPESIPAYYGRGVVRQSQRDHRGAIADFTKVIEHNLGVTQQLLGMNSRALENLYASLCWEPDQESVAIYYARSVARRALDDEQGAQSDFEYATSLETAGSGSLQSNDEHAYYYRGVARHYMGNLEEAIVDLQRSVKIAQMNSNTAFHDKALELIAEWQTAESSDSESEEA
jgi:tetratricopeptide (TPR) repeat protein